MIHRQKRGDQFVSFGEEEMKKVIDHEFHFGEGHPASARDNVFKVSFNGKSLEVLNPNTVDYTNEQNHLKKVRINS